MTTILQDDDPLLRTVSEPVTDFGMSGPNLDYLLHDMSRAMGNGLGLSAIQIGVPLRVLIIAERGQRLLPMVNPAMTRVGRELVNDGEGCLSIERGTKRLFIARHKKCDVTWLTPDGQEQSSTLTGMTARIFQHELDHLNGVLMTDRLSR